MIKKFLLAAAVMGINREIEREGKDRDDIGRYSFNIQIIRL